MANTHVSINTQNATLMVLAMKPAQIQKSFMKQLQSVKRISFLDLGTEILSQIGLQSTIQMPKFGLLHMDQNHMENVLLQS